MWQFNKFRDTKGFIRTWEWVVRFRDMITEEAQRRVKILAFWEKHGEAAAKDAFSVSRPTLYRWQKKLKEAGGQVQALNKKSTAPKRCRRRVIPPAVEAFIIKERQRDIKAVWLKPTLLSASPMASSATWSQPWIGNQSSGSPTLTPRTPRRRRLTS